MPLGPLMLNVEGIELSAEDRELLLQPCVGGVILFERNYESPSQLTDLVSSIRELRDPKLLVAVDQEGGRVQRFRDGFTVLPAASKIGEIYSCEPLRALELARGLGWLLASELRCFCIDFSFAPVLDLRKHHIGAIGERAFHEEPVSVASLAKAEIEGLADAGMIGVGKHFPGHGSVSLDSHHVTPVDEREFDVVAQTDLLVFERMIRHGLAAIMSSHIIFPRIDSALVTCSRRWMSDILRGHLRFEGVIFSDDLSMRGARQAGDLVIRCEAALHAGCDMILVCNDRRGAIEVVDRLEWISNAGVCGRLEGMRGRGAVTREQLLKDPKFDLTKRRLHEIE